MNLLCQNTPRDDNLPTLAAFGGHELGDYLCRRHGLVGMAVVPYPDHFLIRNSEVHTANAASSPAFQFAKPLMGDVKVAGDGHRKDPRWAVVRRLAEPPDSIATDKGHSRFGGKVDKYRHSGPALPNATDQRVTTNEFQSAMGWTSANGRIGHCVVAEESFGLKPFPQPAIVRPSRRACCLIRRAIVRAFGEWIQVSDSGPCSPPRNSAGVQMKSWSNPSSCNNW